MMFKADRRQKILKRVSEKEQNGEDIIELFCRDYRSDDNTLRTVITDSCYMPEEDEYFSFITEYPAIQ